MISNAEQNFITLHSSDNCFLLSEELIAGVDSKTHCIHGPTSSHELINHQSLEGVVDHINRIVDSTGKGGDKLWTKIESSQTEIKELLVTPCPLRGAYSHGRLSFTLFE